MLLDNVEMGAIEIWIYAIYLQNTLCGSSYWKSLRYRKVQLGVDKGNPQSNAFWRKNHFSVINKRESTGTHDIVLMERTL